MDRMDNQKMIAVGEKPAPASLNIQWGARAMKVRGSEIENTDHFYFPKDPARQSAWTFASTEAPKEPMSARALLGL